MYSLLNLTALLTLQDVYTIKFSPYFDGILNSCGTGHIRFWKMASTFTGLKLQGQLGKFGNVELTDVVAFVEMPDGKVLSSTETGELLMWDGGLIKVRDCPLFGGLSIRSHLVSLLLQPLNELHAPSQPNAANVAVPSPPRWSFSAPTTLSPPPR